MLADCCCVQSETLVKTSDARALLGRCHAQPVILRIVLLPPPSLVYAHRKLWGSADSGLRLTHRTEDLA